MMMPSGESTVEVSYSRAKTQRQVTIIADNTAHYDDFVFDASTLDLPV
jgi:hypothetical protein